MGGPSLGAWRHPVLMVGTDPVEVDRLLTGGELRCPGCGGELRPWGYARLRGVRGEDAIVMSRPRRSSCLGGRSTWHRSSPPLPSTPKTTTAERTEPWYRPTSSAGTSYTSWPTSSPPPST